MLCKKIGRHVHNVIKLCGLTFLRINTNSCNAWMMKHVSIAPQHCTILAINALLQDQGHVESKEYYPSY